MPSRPCRPEAAFQALPAPPADARSSTAALVLALGVSLGFLCGVGYALLVVGVGR